MNLDKLIKDCKRQKLSAQNQLYHLFCDKIFTVCLKYCKNKEEAQDNLHDTFIEVFQKIKSYKGKGSFEGWIKRIAINKAINKYKKDRTVLIEIKEVILQDPTNNENVTQNVSIERILNHIQSLPSQYRLVFNLFELDNYSHREISELLGISVNTSKSNLHRAKKILQTKMASLKTSSTHYSARHGK